MRKILPILVLFVAASSTFTAHAQTADSSLNRLIAHFEQLIPYTDSTQPFAITQIVVDTSQQFVRLGFRINDGRDVNSDIRQYLDYLAAKPDWDLIPIATSGYGLRLNVHTPSIHNEEGFGTLAVSYNNMDVRNAIRCATARKNVMRYAQTAQLRLPQETGKGEKLVECNYTNDSTPSLTMVMEYADEFWDKLRPFITSHYDEIRQHRLEALVQDTISNIASNLAVGEVGFRFICRNESKTDSIAFFIPTQDIFLELKKGLRK